jgi:hypothetical protein
MTNLPPVIVCRNAGCGRTVNQVQAATPGLSSLRRYSASAGHRKSDDLPRSRRLSDHMEEIEQNNDGDRYPENPKQNATHDEPRSLECIESQLTAINGTSMAGRIT